MCQFYRIHTHCIYFAFSIISILYGFWFMILSFDTYMPLSLSHTKHWHFSQFSLLITLFSLMSMCVHTFIVDICEKLYLNKFIENGALWFRLWLQNFLYIYIFSHSLSYCCYILIRLTAGRVAMIWKCYKTWDFNSFFSFNWLGFFC